MAAALPRGVRMSSPTSHPAVPPSRRIPYLLLQDEPPPLASKGQGVLASLLHSRSTTNLHRGESDDHSSRWLREDEDPDSRPRLEERRLSAILDTPQMRSMRLIGNSNPRYLWERYWKTEEQLKPLKKPVCVSQRSWLASVFLTR